MRFIAVAASSMTGRSCWQYTVSVTVVVRCRRCPHHSVAIQLFAQEARAWARIGDRRSTEVALDKGRLLLEVMPYPDNLDHHFVVDPTKYDFYMMDCYRHLAEDRMAETLASEVIRASTDFDGTEGHPRGRPKHASPSLSWRPGEATWKQRSVRASGLSALPASRCRPCSWSAAISPGSSTTDTRTNPRPRPTSTRSTLSAPDRHRLHQPLTQAPPDCGVGESRVLRYRPESPKPCLQASVSPHLIL